MRRVVGYRSEQTWQTAFLTMQWNVVIYVCMYTHTHMHTLDWQHQNKVCYRNLKYILMWNLHIKFTHYCEITHLDKISHYWKNTTLVHKDRKGPRWNFCWANTIVVSLSPDLRLHLLSCHGLKRNLTIVPWTPLMEWVPGFSQWATLTDHHAWGPMGLTGDGLGVPNPRRSPSFS